MEADFIPTRLQMGTNGLVCFNVLHPGFVQVSPDIPLALMLRSSTHVVQQCDMLLSLHQECASGNWRFMVEDKHVSSGQRKNSLICNKGQLLFRAEGRFAAH